MATFRVHGYLQDGFDIIAHRGDSQNHPENSIEAFDAAVRIFPKVILELDVRQTKDDHIVVFHDATLERVFSVPSEIRNLTLQELQNLPGEFKIPTLEEVLSRFENSRVSIDIKDNLKGVVEKVLDVVEKCGATNRVIVSSFNSSNMIQARKLDSRLCTGFTKRELLKAMISENLPKLVKFPTRGDVLQIPIQEKIGPGEIVDVKVYSKALVELAHQNGKKVHVWTINDEDQMKKLILDGVDGIVTDAPRLLLKVARDLKKVL